MAKYGAIGQNAEGHTNYGLQPPFDPTRDRLNSAEAAVAEQRAVDEAWSAPTLTEAATALRVAASYAVQCGRMNAALKYQLAANHITAGLPDEARSVLVSSARR